MECRAEYVFIELSYKIILNLRKIRNDNKNIDKIRNKNFNKNKNI
jgi:hypothetical protein